MPATAPSFRAPAATAMATAALEIDGYVLAHVLKQLRIRCHLPTCSPNLLPDAAPPMPDVSTPAMCTQV